MSADQSTPENSGEGLQAEVDQMLDDVQLPDLNPTNFINREISWLEFNRRVLGEAEDPANPLLEQVKFLSIFSSNMDEFFMIRVAGVRRKVTAGVVEPGVDGRTPVALFAVIRSLAKELNDHQMEIFKNDSLPGLRKEGINIEAVADLPESSQKSLESYFMREVFPILTPQAIDRSRRFPHISNESLNLLVELRSESSLRFARIKVPKITPRFVRVASEDDHDDGDEQVTLVWLEDLIATHLHKLFPGYDAVASYPFHVTRDSDIEIGEEDDAAHDLLRAMREMLSERTFGSVVRCVVDTTMPTPLREWLLEEMGAAHRDLYINDGPLALEDLIQLMALDRPELKDPPFFPAPLVRSNGSGSLSPEINAWGTDDIFGVLRERDVLVHHPYETFAIVSDFLKAAAKDPDVIAIKQTLYRVGKDSPLIPALIEARDDDTQVAVLVELKARFDEENNISWSQQLEEHGVHVAYGVMGLKTHCKLTLVIRRESDGLRRYAHMATGNYNASTARLYEDVGLFTSREDMTLDVLELFNVLTGFSDQDSYRELWVAPHSLRSSVTAAIRREIEIQEQGGKGRLIFKMNALVDREIVQLLYAASQAGVEIDLIVRGACCLRPGIPNLSENIQVRSVIGRFLEHSRIYYFGNGGEDQIYLGSADLMDRNLDKRVEAVFPILDPVLKQHIRDEILPVYLSDNFNAWRLKNDASWELVRRDKGVELIDVQGDLLELYGPGGIFGEIRETSSMS